MKELVVGGAGYVGTHASLALAQAGHEVTVYDDLSTGHSEAAQLPSSEQARELCGRPLGASKPHALGRCLELAPGAVWARPGQLNR